MSSLVETIRFENGQLHNMNLHQERFDRSRVELYGEIEEIWLHSEIAIPDTVVDDTVYKVRVLYERSIIAVEWHAYQMKAIETLQLVEANDIDYHLKSVNRSTIDELVKFANGADSILIVKNGMITDSAYANILFRKDCEWVTPSSPLLRGVMREYLIREGKIKEVDICVNNLYTFNEFKLINAMIPFENFKAEPIQNIWKIRV